jgi:ABC-type glycerol-3-phosphate transport system substrate-binding protein
LGGSSLLSSCGGGGNSSSGSESYSALFPYNTNQERDAILKQINAYKAQHNVDFNVQDSSWNDIDQLIQTRVAAGDYPDFLMATPDRISVFADKLVDISDTLPSGAAAQYDKAGWQAVNIDDKVTGLPRCSSIFAAIYNVDYFEKAGIQAPQTADEAWTWDELEQAAVALQQKAGAKYGLQFGDPSFDGITQFFFQRGGSLMNEDMTEAAIDSAEGVATLQWIADLHSKGIAAPGIFDGSSDGLQFFVSGISGIWLGESNTKIPDLQTKMTQYKWNYMPGPRMEKNVTQIAPVQWAGFQSEKTAKSLSDFMQFMTTPDVQAQIASASGTVPSKIDSAKKTAWKIRPDLLDFFLTYRSSATDLQLQAEVVSPIYGAARPALLQDMAKLASGSLSPKDAAADMSDIINQQITKFAG